MINSILAVLKSENLVDETNDKIVSFGLTKLQNMLTDLLFTVLFAMFLGNIYVGILFEIAYSVPRVFAGGYHASNKRICKYLTYVSIMLSLLFIFRINLNTYLMHGLLILETCMMIFFAPVENKNKPLNKMERKIYHTYCIYISIAECIIYSICILSNMMLYAKTIFVSVSLVVVGLLAEMKLSSTSV